jgi:hypothetical protein
LTLDELVTLHKSREIDAWVGETDRRLQVAALRRKDKAVKVRRATIAKRAGKLRWEVLEPEYESQRRRLLGRYGLTIKAWENLFAQQGRVCAICGKDKNTGRNGTFHTDHCHATQKVRGILCSSCNTLLGLANDSIAVLTAAIKYLERHT